ncbi:hypothetical protein FACS189468_9220 [Spirochaetia bacterium]|nr:hypothetical protein FACS189468_9220 [Spirochaetia bacterium]
MDMAAVINTKKCVYCGACQVWCPRKAVVKKAEGLKVLPERCVSCGLCVHRCLGFAIRLENGELNSTTVLKSNNE